jgi:transposase
MLYWLKTQAVATRQELAQRLGRNESTIYRWVQRYQSGGIDALLEVKKAPGKTNHIPKDVMNQLRERLSQPQGFNSYIEVHQWLTQECEMAIAYKSVHKIVRYQLKAKLKVARPRSAKAEVKVQQTFKKNCPLSSKC